MKGVGHAGGAGTIVNAFATGRGAAFGLAWGVTARVGPAARASVTSSGRRVAAREARLALVTARTVQTELGSRGPLRIEVRSDIPSKRGLKSSSAVGVAVARATANALHQDLDDVHLLKLVAQAAQESRTSLTGALDDAAACLWGGVNYCDNDGRRVLRHTELPEGLVALVRVPHRTLSTGSLSRGRFRRLAPLVSVAWRAAWKGDIPTAMDANTDAYAPLLDVDPRFSRKARKEGAWAAGLSGKGPAEIALVHARDARRIRRALGPCRVVDVAAGGHA